MAYWCLTLKANVFPVCTKARTVQPAADQPLINGLEDTHVNCLAVVHGAYRRYTNMQRHTQICKKESQCFHRKTHGLYTMWDDYTNRSGTCALTLCNGKDKIPLLQEFPV